MASRIAHWTFADASERDLFGVAQGVAEADICYVKTTRRWYRWDSGPEEWEILTEYPGGAVEVYDLDFTSHSTLTVAAGANTIDGLTWTAENVASSDTFAITSSGLEILPSNLPGATTIHNTTRTAPLIHVPLLSLLPGLLLRGQRVRVYVDFEINMTANYHGCGVLIEAPEATPVSAVKRVMFGTAYNSGARFQVQSQSTGIYETTYDTSHRTFIVDYDLTSLSANLYSAAVAWSGISDWVGRGAIQQGSSADASAPSALAPRTIDPADLRVLLWGQQAQGSVNGTTAFFSRLRAELWP